MQHATKTKLARLGEFLNDSVTVRMIRVQANEVTSASTIDEALLTGDATGLDSVILIEQICGDDGVVETCNLLTKDAYRRSQLYLHMSGPEAEKLRTELNASGVVPTMFSRSGSEAEHWGLLVKLLNSTDADFQVSFNSLSAVGERRQVVECLYKYALNCLQFPGTEMEARRILLKTLNKFFSHIVELPLLLSASEENSPAAMIEFAQTVLARTESNRGVN